MIFYYYLRAEPLLWPLSIPQEPHVHFSENLGSLVTRGVFAWSGLLFGVTTPCLFVVIRGYAPDEAAGEAATAQNLAQRLRATRA